MLTKVHGEILCLVIKQLFYTWVLQRASVFVMYLKARQDIKATISFYILQYLRWRQEGGIQSGSKRRPRAISLAVALKSVRLQSIPLLLESNSS